MNRYIRMTLLCGALFLVQCGAACRHPGNYPGAAACFAADQPLSGEQANESANRKTTDLFLTQMRDGGAGNYGLQYSIELTRDDKTFYVGSKFPFRTGDQIRFHVRPNVDGYMYVVLKSGSTGSKAVLFPVPDAPDDNAVRRGREYTLPSNGALVFDANPGEETVRLLLCAQQLDDASIDRYERKVTIRPKTDAIAAGCFVSVPPMLLAGNGGASDLVTLIATDTSSPLCVDLVLQHNPGGGSGSPVVETYKSTPARSNAVPTEQVKRSIQDGQWVSSDSPIRDKWALVIGLSRFKTPGMSLLYASKDARDFADFLVKEERFSPDHVKVLTDEQASYDAIMNEMRSSKSLLPANVQRGDLVVIYAATHATSAKDDPIKRQNFLVAYDTDPADPAPRGIELQHLSQTIKDRLDTDRVMIVLDTCHAGAGKDAFGDDAPKSRVGNIFQGSGQLILAASDADQVSFDSLKFHNGLFTRYLIDGLRKYPELAKAFAYTQDAVKTESLAEFHRLQSPVLKFDEWRGKMLVLSAPPAQPRKPKMAP